MSPEADALWRWVGSVCTDAKRTHWCKSGTNSGPTYSVIVGEDVVDEVIDEKFGSTGGGRQDLLNKYKNYVQFGNSSELFWIYVMPKIRKADQERGCMINFHARSITGTWGVLRINLHVHFRTYEKMQELQDKAAQKEALAKGEWAVVKN